MRSRAREAELTALVQYPVKREAGLRVRVDLSGYTHLIRQACTENGWPAWSLELVVVHLVVDYERDHASARLSGRRRYPSCGALQRNHQSSQSQPGVWVWMELLPSCGDDRESVIREQLKQL